MDRNATSEQTTQKHCDHFGDTRVVLEIAAKLYKEALLSIIIVFNINLRFLQICLLEPTDLKVSAEQHTKPYFPVQLYIKPSKINDE